jgi:hypothetical protein
MAVANTPAYLDMTAIMAILMGAYSQNILKDDKKIL